MHGKLRFFSIRRRDGKCFMQNELFYSDVELMDRKYCIFFLSFMSRLHLLNISISIIVNECFIIYNIDAVILSLSLTIYKMQLNE